jgi:hypothetical protein
MVHSTTLSIHHTTDNRTQISGKNGETARERGPRDPIKTGPFERRKMGRSGKSQALVVWRSPCTAGRGFKKSAKNFWIFFHARIRKD